MWYIFDLAAHEVTGPFHFTFMARLFAIAHGIGAYSIMSANTRYDDPFVRSLDIRSPH